MPGLDLPPRYEPLSELGKGGGGEVWVVRDRYTGTHLALKVLAEEASEREMAALVREAVALSGLEGLGVPRVVHFGRLPGSGRPFMLRELVAGENLQALIERGDDGAFSALARAAEQLTVLHRAGLLHGDVKPANIIVAPDGRATLVDLGLAAPWQDSGAPAEGLTPKYAAPELLEGGPLTVRAEVYAFGVALDAAVGARRKLDPQIRRELSAVVKRATAEDPSARFPSADELASALRRAARLGGKQERAGDRALWPVVGIENSSSLLLSAVGALGPGAALDIKGPAGSGRTTLLRRVAWSLGIEGHRLAWVDESLRDKPAAVQAELAAYGDAAGLTLLVDDADALDKDSVEALRKLRAAGARVVTVGSGSLCNDSRSFEVPPLDRHVAVDLVRRTIPSLTGHLLERVVERSRCRPGELRRLVRRIASEAVASDEDFERMIAEDEAAVSSALPGDALERAVFFLDRSRFNEARASLDALESPHDPLALVIARARLDLGLGEAAAALERLQNATPLAERVRGSETALVWALYLSRAHIGAGQYARALELTAPLIGEATALGAEALAYQGLALSFLGRHDEARAALERSIERAAGSARVEAIALTTLGLALQRADHIEEARAAYERGLTAAERASEAGVLATLQLNLAGLKKMGGDIAGAIEHFKAAIDMGRRSGRRSTVRYALLNLANTDLYLGRQSRARESIEVLEAQRAQLPLVARAQLAGLHAELSGRLGHLEQAAREYEACAAAYDALGRSVDSAEARLEGVLVAARGINPDIEELRCELQRARNDLGGTSAHRPLLLLATARVASMAGDDLLARTRLDGMLVAARETNQREWIWRALEARAELEEAGGQPLLARRDREEALATLEEIGARLPRDLREVYWNDPRRRQLRASVQISIVNAPTDQMPFDVRVSSREAPGHGAPTYGPGTLASPGVASISSMTSTPLEQRLARILEVNAELAGELDLDRLTARVTDHAVALLRAEHGFVLLLQEDGTLSVHTSRSRVGDDQHAEFSRSIAANVIARGEPIVTLSARDDARMKSYASVHQLMLQSVACVPIMAPSGRPIGALYVETRVHPGQHFQHELPALRAFADQVAIAIETARLVGENRRRADELQEANAELEETQARLRELLGDRTAKLKRARKRLRDARDTLLGHFGYQGLVGTSESMRKVYALMDRVKDTEVPVLITGESGTGKEVVARALHNASSRVKARFLGVNCGAIPENLLESELFGHVKGAFTGADRDRKGLFREGEGGTVLLDEVGEMPHRMQASMLRVLQDRKVRPVGGTREELVDVRLLFATNRDLADLVQQGRFREDLYYRIHVIELRLPPLRERPEDIPQLVDHFLGLFSARYKREKKTLSHDAMRRLAGYVWPGNVRQLEHVLLNAWVLSDRPELEAADLDLPDDLAPMSRAPAPPSEARATEPSAAAPREAGDRRSTLSQHRREERDHIIEALQACNWNRVKAAELSGIPRRTFYRRLREYGIQ